MKKCARSIFAVFLSVFGLLAQTADLNKRPERFEREREYDALHYKLAFSFDEAAKAVFGRADVTLSSLRDSLDRIVLDAVQLKVEDVRDEKGGPLAFEQGPGTLTVVLPKGLAYGERTALSVRYVLKDPQRGLKFVPASPEHPAQINTYSWPEDARSWFPCFDSPNDKATSEVLATVRKGWSVLSNGRLVEVAEDTAAGTLTYHWLQDRPHPVYNVMMAAGPFEVVKDRLGELPVDYWVYSRAVPDASRSFHKTPAMIDFYGRLFDYPYPWAKYDQVCYAGYGGGMEATSSTMLGDDTIHDARADQDFSSDSLVAHELAHQWWGDLVTERYWTDVWLSESFATYSEYLWTRHDLGEDEGSLNLEEKKAAYLREAKTRYIRPLVFNRFNAPWEVMDGHSYPKGAAVLNVLRAEVGEAPFFRALSLFLHRYEFRSVDTRDLMEAFKDATGRNVDWFFDQWVFRPGHPVFEVSWTWDDAAHKAEVKIVQAQDAAKGIPIYRMPVRIGLFTASGKRVETVEISKKEETFGFSCRTRPLLVRFDDGNILLKEVSFSMSGEELLYQLGHDDAVGRMAAAAALAGRTGDPAVVSALKKAAASDPFWAVRRAALESLAKAEGGPWAAFFKERSIDSNSRVRAAAVRALGDRRDNALIPFFRERFAKDDSYVAQAECLNA
ncbi:MAG: M1 family aminopeptidase, partial [Candidatus Aminicenantales bacterium]